VRQIVNALSAAGLMAVMLLLWVVSLPFWLFSLLIGNGRCRVCGRPCPPRGVYCREHLA
jgi:hypothetical protein